MKQALLILSCWLLTFGTAHGQINWGDYSQSFPNGATDQQSTIALILAIPKENNSFWVTNPESKYFTELAKDSAFSKARPNNIVARTTFDQAPAHFFLHGVNLKNAHLYQFRVISYPGNNIVIPWRAVNRFTDSTVTKHSGLPRMAYLGGYKAPSGKMLIMDVRNVESGQIIATAMIAWEPIKPIISNIYTSKNFDEFLKKLQYPWAAVKEPAAVSTGNVKIPFNNTNIIFFLKADIYSRKQVQYQLIRKGKIVTPWRYNDYDNSFIWIKDCPPGDYVVRIRYTVQPQHITESHFEIEPAWYQTNLFRVITGIFTTSILGALLFIVLFIRQRQKTTEELATRTKLQLEMKAIYAQLNPHFVFNALSSIQGLINKQDIRAANNYLSDFAQLLRQSLNNSNKDDIPIKEELHLLNNYLKLEQLRFGFSYHITADPEINVYESNIPALLLQPLVENAVKHGLSSLHGNGMITIVFKKNGNTMLVVITDNGKGFNDQNLAGGFGLKLTHDRIKLLNGLQPKQPIEIALLQVVPSGMQITLTFNHWFL
jgi:two-component system LytT family sensor kinase